MKVMHYSYMGHTSELRRIHQKQGDQGWSHRGASLYALTLLYLALNRRLLGMRRRTSLLPKLPESLNEANRRIYRNPSVSP